jgi:hypothetical protein
MNYKYTTNFENVIHASVDVNSSEFYISNASLDYISELFPSDIDLNQNIDLLGVNFHGAVVNAFNKNGDGIDTKSAKAIEKYFLHKPTNIEHNKERIVGHIVNTGMADFETGKVLNQKDIDDENLEKFNMSFASVIYKNNHPDFAELVQNSTDENHKNFGVISASWELGFNEYYIAAGSKHLKDAEIITNPDHVKELSEHLSAFDGSGELKDGTPIYRLVVGDIYPLGIGFTANPAADVKGIAIADSKKKSVAKIKNNSTASEVIKIDNKIFYQKNKNKTSQNEDFNVISPVTHLSHMEKEQLLEDFKSLLNEKLPEHNFSEEVVANVSKAIGDAIKSKSEEYQLKLQEVENEREAIAQAEATMKKEVEDLKSQLEQSSQQVEELSQQVHTIKAEEAFNQRMAKVSETYTLSEDDQRIISAELQALDLGEQPFEDYSSKLSVVLAHKSKEYIAQQEEEFNQRIEAELQKRLGKDVDFAAVASTEETSESAEAVLETVEAEEQTITNNNLESAQEEDSLKNKFASAFSKENLSIQY